MPDSSPCRLPLIVRSRLDRPYPESEAKKQEKGGDGGDGNVIAEESVLEADGDGEGQEIDHGEQGLHGKRWYGMKS